MLRRDRQIRMQIHQLMDACLFALGFWLAYVLRSNPNVGDLLNLPPVNEFRDYRSQIRMQIHQLMDACLFALGFWLAYVLRSNPNVGDLLNLPPVNEFRDYRW